MHFASANLIASILPMQVHGGRVWLYILGAAVVGTLALVGLTAIPQRFRKLVVAGITFAGGLYFSLEFLLPHQPVHVGKATLPGSAGVAHFAGALSKAKPGVADWAIVIGSFAVLLGVSNLFQIHGRAVKKRGEGWYNSLAFFISFFLIMIFGFAKDAAHGAAQGASASLFSILFNGFVQNLDAAMFSLVAFYIVSAAYRAFRIRSAEAALMMATAAVIMLGLVPVGAMMTSWLPHSGPLGFLRLENLTIWLLTWPNMAVQRAMQFGIGIGGLAMALRIWLSLERGSFFDRQL